LRAVAVNDNDLCLSSTFHLAASSRIQKCFIWLTKHIEGALCLPLKCNQRGEHCN